MISLKRKNKKEFVCLLLRNGTGRCVINLDQVTSLFVETITDTTDNSKTDTLFTVNYGENQFVRVDRDSFRGLEKLIEDSNTVKYLY